MSDEERAARLDRHLDGLTETLAFQSVTLPGP
jgi:hypothetical protein